MLLKGIFWTNNKKHGFIRGTIGGYIMYPSVAIFFIFQVLFLKILTKALTVLSKGTKILDKEDFVSYGRINLADYSWFDRMNCHFCAYANGTTHMVAATLDEIGKCNISSIDDPEKKKAERLLSKAFFWAKPVGIVGLGFVLAFEKLLGYRRSDLNAIKDDLKRVNYGQGLKSGNMKSVYQNAFKLRILFQSFQTFLSTIESNWCPLTYANKKFLLEHQEKFISTGYDDVVKHIYKTKPNEMPVGSGREDEPVPAAVAIEPEE
ncbi:MAG: hypothetical protein GXY14_09485 [Spirochaetes bacterium]|nr:hypothetical protein [Spirochaetota bacterium]